MNGGSKGGILLLGMIVRHTLRAWEVDEGYFEGYRGVCFEFLGSEGSTGGSKHDQFFKDMIKLFKT